MRALTVGLARSRRRAGNSRDSRQGPRPPTRNIAARLTARGKRRNDFQSIPATRPGTFIVLAQVALPR